MCFITKAARRASRAAGFACRGTRICCIVLLGQAPYFFVGAGFCTNQVWCLFAQMSYLWPLSLKQLWKELREQQGVTSRRGGFSSAPAPEALIKTPRKPMTPFKKEASNCHKDWLLAASCHENPSSAKSEEEQETHCNSVPRCLDGPHCGWSFEKSSIFASWVLESNIAVCTEWPHQRTKF